MNYDKAKKIYQEVLEKIETDGLFKEERSIQSIQSGKVKVSYPIGSTAKDVINLCSNNYLGLSAHPEVLAAAHAGLDRRGFGMSSVRFICGTQDIHLELEKKVSIYLGMEATCLFASCFDANAALFETILTKEDGVFSDKLVHASLIDGMRLCKAQKNIYEHSDLNDLRKKLEDSNARIKLIITDGVFSMDGDMARLDEICDIADQFGALVAVDDSHATGFIGKKGRGTHEHFGVMGRVDIVTTTFGKALGGATGGCISGRSEIIDLLKQRARPYLFSNSLMPAVVCATLKVLDILMEDTSRRDHLEKLTQFWRDGLAEIGLNLCPGNTPIIPIMLYDASLAQKFAKMLFQEGVYAVGFSYPVVPKGQARIRTQISAALSQDDLEFSLGKFRKIAKELKII